MATIMKPGHPIAKNGVGILFLLAVCFIVGCSPSLPDPVEEAYTLLPDEVDYNFHVKPILADRCYACHGPDEGSRKGNLRLDIEEEAFAELASGNYAFVKGSIRKSEVYHRLVSEDPEYIMPPPESKLSLTPKEIAIIVKWIEQGSNWKPHWSFLKVEKPEVPEAKKDWVAVNPIDNFIQSELIRQGLSPNPEADRERLIRRVTLDLTGLPPTIEEIDNFLKDKSPAAYEKVVDRLLKTQAHAERLTMEWLDVARYADSHGVSFDGYREMWPYRDWVIEKFKTNLPYNDFITKQVAGDLLPGAKPDDKLATAFYRQNPMEASQGSIGEEYRVEYVAERTATTGTAFLGLTIGCARCHDHKFDPITQKNFFQLSAFFNSVDEYGLGPADASRPPTLVLYEDDQLKSLDSIDALIATHEAMLKKAEAGQIKDYVSGLSSADQIENQIGSFSFESFEKVKRKKKEMNPFADDEKAAYEKKTAKEKAKADSVKKTRKIEYEEVLILDKNKKSEATLGVSLAEGKRGKGVSFDHDYDYVSLNDAGWIEHYESFSASVWVNPKKSEKPHIKTVMGNSNNYSGMYRGWEFALDSTNRLSMRMIHRLPDDYLEVVTEKSVPFEKWTQVAFTYDGSQKAGGISIFINGQKQKTKTLSDELTRSIRSINSYTNKYDTLPIRLGKSYRVWTFDPGIFQGSMDEVRLFNRELTQLEMARLGENTTLPISAEIASEHNLAKAKEIIALEGKLKTFRKAKAEIMGTTREIMVMEDMPKPRKTYLLSRGVYNQYLEEVQTGTPESVLPFPEDYPKNRLGLAKWLVNEDNPLTSRVTINRYWQMIFGTGLVKTTGDFGIQGELPSHPELLDWLAGEFMESNWDLRKMLKLMVMSSTYKQSSYADSEKYEADPDNRYYARGSSYRWPAEIIRDNALASSGILQKKIGGPSTKPYQPEGLWEELGNFSYKLYSYKQDTGANLHRRSLYTFTRRFSPAPFMTTFDAGNREICITRRVNTNTPLQALNLLNDPQFVEASRSLSERMLKEKVSLDEQLTHGFRLSTGVTPSPQLLATLREHYQSAFAHFQKHPNLADSLLAVGEIPRDIRLDKTKAAALTIVANSIFNFDETYMKR
jgi:hypothetical protein